MVVTLNQMGKYLVPWKWLFFGKTILFRVYVWIAQLSPPKVWWLNILLVLHPPPSIFKCLFHQSTIITPSNRISKWSYFTVDCSKARWASIVIHKSKVTLETIVHYCWCRFRRKFGEGPWLAFWRRVWLFLTWLWNL